MRYQSSRPKRQFLAGVRCPKCEATNAIVQVQVFTPAPDEYIECNECGHSERRPDPEPISAKNHAEDQLTRDAMATGTSGTVKFRG
jgi:uncharacterized metal-binding protein (TIGR02443 family)